MPTSRRVIYAMKKDSDHVFWDRDVERAFEPGLDWDQFAPVAVVEIAGDVDLSRLNLHEIGVLGITWRGVKLLWPKSAILEMVHSRARPH